MKCNNVINNKSNCPTDTYIITYDPCIDINDKSLRSTTMRVRTNQNTELVSKIRDKLKENGGYCPCRVKKNEDTKCMCKEFRDMIDNGELGSCHCGLYQIEQD